MCFGVNYDNSLHLVHSHLSYFCLSPHLHLHLHLHLHRTSDCTTHPQTLRTLSSYRATNPKVAPHASLPPTTTCYHRRVPPFLLQSPATTVVLPCRWSCPALPSLVRTTFSRQVSVLIFFYYD